MTVTFVQVPFAAMYLQLVIIVPCVGSSHSDILSGRYTSSVCDVPSLLGLVRIIFTICAGSARAARTNILP